jgi:DNA-directed RNA polymerase subunit F
MNTKLTLSLDKKVIEYAKDLARKNGKSLSELVENYFKHLTSNEINKEITSLSPKVKKLKGIIKVE